MSVSAETVEMLAAKLEVILPHLDERQRRLLLGAEARALGHGGIRAVAQAASVREATVSRGVDELEAGAEPLGRVRRPGGGRKRLVDIDPQLRAMLLALVEPDERGDPTSPLRWTTKSTRKLAGELTGQGHRVSADTVADILRTEGFSLQGNAKTLEGGRHPDRDAQFRHLNEQVRAYRDAGQPVISVDTKKKELLGPFKNAGREWRPAGEPVLVNVHDFAESASGKAIPYGIYDIAANTGWVNVGTDHDTAAFAVASIRRWWHAQGSAAYPQATRLLITADAGGANGYRTRAWKSELAALAAETGLTITVCHLPPGTSKWNKVEHRLFAHITMNWRGRPLTSHEVVVNSIAATTTSTGLQVQAALDTGVYPLGARVSDAELAALPLTRHLFHGDWNYTLHPTLDTDPDATGHDQPAERWDPQVLSDPTLTGMPRPELDRLTINLQARDQQRPRIKAGRPPTVAFTDQVLLTVLHQRLGLAIEPLAVLFGTSRTTAYRTTRSIGLLLDQHGTHIPPAPTPPGLLRVLHARVLAEDTKAANKIKPAC
ncbi:transposase [[Actinomadura] parvosata subsp. kistnae]|uniref:Transposase n=1 Tax=[Actinomadura] parvosata subsp. kistnae TaxID=1909395 RepID=A0A1V0A306_9ACTN|nr:ISAzo13 family transposase [Nonomuraea sp. ATCC 55076]AQZ62732.1 transposase [Nonomuraea sp. ATCC 55076]AQZ63327.1 transposase [Nonomuraea sp. ATCC 55076]AQZ64593.1 transposase [Nonomuraea sp. ATCC 55076]AQZ65658.1 transposase [Nonomuraea sp. ATCC 55076]AQZ66988.1 transposase [Nonomuraea sp. ATCC 55076]